jgi:hypothetical protein
MALAHAWRGRRKRSSCSSYRPLVLALEDRTLLSFIAAASYDVGSRPYSVAVGDFNGDGLPDLAVANQSNASVSVLLGNGNGTFQAARSFGVGSGPFRFAVSYAVGYQPVSLVVGDFNGDGIPDVAVANAFSPNGTVTVLLGNGDGTFQAPVSYNAGASPGSLTEGDFAGDGILDLAVANSAAGTVSILRGRGDGTFEVPVTFVVGSGPSSVVVGDFNGDGFLDLAVTNSNSGTVSVLLGRGDGTFQPRLDYSSSGSNPASVGTADFNGDGFPDLAVANFGSNSVTVLINDGVWGPAPQPAGHSHGEPPALVAAVPDIGWPSALLLTTSPADGTLLREVLDNPPGSPAIPTWERATNPPLGRSDARSPVPSSRDLLFAGWDSAWLADALVDDPNLAWIA